MDDGTNWWDSFVDWGTDLYDTYAPEVTKAYDNVADTVTKAYDNVADTVTDFEFPSFNDGAGDYNPRTDLGFSYGADYSAGAGTDLGSGVNANSRGYSLNANAPSFNEGSGPSGLRMNSATGGASFDTALNTSDGVAGAFGVDPSRSNGQPKTRSILEGGDQRVTANYALDGGGSGTFTERAPAPAQDGFRGAVNRAETGLRGVQDFARDNYNVARLGLDLAGMGLSYKNRNDANDLAREQMQMQRAAQQKNAAVADRANAQSAQSFNEARSLYNPQEMAVRSMADAKMANMRAQEAARNQMQKSGRSKGTIDAEMRRAQLAGTTNANTAYLRGLDTGRAAQQSALSSAGGLARNYNTGADYSAADRVSKAGQSNSDQLTSMLNNYLGNPIYQQNAAAQRRAQQDAYYYQ